MLTTSLPSTSFDVSLGNGVRLRCLEQGAPDGEPVLMLHGWSDSGFSFSPVLPLLSPAIRAIVPDQRGHGESDRPAAGYDMRDLADDALRLLDILRVDRAVVIGHSMGGFVAQHLASRAPGRVSRLILVGTAHEPRTAAVEDMRAALDALTDPVDETFIRDFQAGTIHRPVSAQFFEAVVAESRKLPARVWRALYRGFADRAPADTSRITCPVDVLWGDRDAIFQRETQDLLVSRLRGSALTVIPDVGHAVHWEMPGALVRAIARRAAGS